MTRFGGESIFDECGRLEDQVFSPEILRNSFIADLLRRDTGEERMFIRHWARQALVVI
jgi:hypothetical protein